MLAEFNRLPAEMQARFQKTFRLVEHNGLRALIMPLARPVRSGIWELRVVGRDGQARGLYVADTGQRIVILRFFIKKTQKTPDREIALAETRLREL